jgi:LPS-assembly lipoprotein
MGPEARSKTILSLSGAGRVTEYRLGLRLTYSIVSRDGGVIAEPETIDLSRDLTYDDSQLLAKGAEEQLLYRDMEESATQRILRRLRNLKPGNGSS